MWENLLKYNIGNKKDDKWEKGGMQWEKAKATLGGEMENKGIEHSLGTVLGECWLIYWVMWKYLIFEC